MDNSYTNEFNTINSIASQVHSLQEQLSSLNSQLGAAEFRLASIVPQYDEEGHDLNSGQRAAAAAQVNAIRNSIEQINSKLDPLRENALSMASSYRLKSQSFAGQSKNTGNAGTQLDRLKNYRFGASAAPNAATLAHQRSEHYSDLATVYAELASAAEDASEGVTTVASSFIIAERGSLRQKDAGDISRPQNDAGTIRQATPIIRQQEGSSLSAETSAPSVWTGEIGNSTKRSDITTNQAMFHALGIEGIPYENNTPGFENVSHMNVLLPDDELDVVAAADAALAAEWSITAAEAVNYRKDNNLQWINNTNQNRANLVPVSIAKECGVEKLAHSPRPMDRLTAYMWAHNYGPDDYDVYSHDPEWQALHKAAFPSEHEQNKESEQVYYTCVDDLPDDVFERARDYQANSRKYNELIRNGQTSKDVDELKRIINNHAIAEESIFYRRASLKDLGEAFADTPVEELNNLIGQEYQFSGIMSTSGNRKLCDNVSTGTNGDIIFEIIAPAGTPALDLSRVSFFQEAMFDSPICCIEQVGIENNNTPHITIRIAEYSKASNTKQELHQISEMEKNGEFDISALELSRSPRSLTGPRLTEAPITLTLPANTQRYSINDFAYQVIEQENGLNSLTVYDFITNYENRQNVGRDSGSALVQREYRQALVESITEDFLMENPGISSTQARADAESYVGILAALHNPDQIAGGSEIGVTGAGIRNVNSALGSLWRHGRAQELYRQVMEASRGWSEDQMRRTYLNVRLNVEDRHQ